MSPARSDGILRGGVAMSLRAIGGVLDSRIAARPGSRFVARFVRSGTSRDANPGTYGPGPVG